MARCQHTKGNKWPLLPRLAAGLPLLFFGIMKFVSAGTQENFQATLALADMPAPGTLMWLLAAVEVVAGALLVSGWYARIGGILGVIQMIGALYVHATVDFSAAPAGGPPHWLPILVFVASWCVMIVGGGGLSVDYARERWQLPGNKRD